MKTAKIKNVKEEECDLISEIKVENEEIQMEDSIFMKEHEGITETTWITDKKALGSVDYFQITEIEDKSAKVEGGGSTKEDGFKCFYCETVFPFRHFFVKHLKRVHRGFPRNYTGGVFQCQLCEEAFSEVEILTDHVEEKHPVPLKFKCGECGYQCKSLHRLRLHMIIHMSVKPFRCNTCLKGFNSNSNLTHHMRSDHGFKILIHCSRCPEAFTSAKLLREHVNAVHIDGGIFQCQKCGKTFESEGKHHYHMRSEHRSYSPVSCSVCLKEFKQKYLLKLHMAVHSDETFKCHLCPKTYKQKRTYRKHLQTHDPGSNIKRHICDVCNKGFDVLSVFRRHSETHNKAKIKCPQCPGVCRGKIHLREHIRRSHSGKCTCPVCGKVFSHKDYLRKHSNSHKNPSLQCHLCSKTYMTKEYFLNHLIGFHKMTQGATAECYKNQIMHHKEGTSSKSNSELEEESNLESIIVKTEYEVNKNTELREGKKITLRSTGTPGTI